MATVVINKNNFEELVVKSDKVVSIWLRTEEDGELV